MREPVAKPTTNTDYLMMEWGKHPDLSNAHGDAVVAAIEELDEMDRQIIQDYYYSQRSLRNIAREYGTNQVNIMRRLRKIEAALRPTLEADETISRRYHLEDLG